VLLLTAISYAEKTLAQSESRIVVRCPGNLNMTETFQCLQAILGVIEPHYDERTAPQAALVGR